MICVVPLAKSPGFQMWEQMDPDGAAAFEQTVPLGYVGDCEHDVGGAVAFLCGPGAAYITATTITIDGGQAYVR